MGSGLFSLDISAPGSENCCVPCSFPYGGGCGDGGGGGGFVLMLVIIGCGQLPQPPDFT